MKIAISSFAHIGIYYWFSNFHPVYISDVGNEKCNKYYDIKMLEILVLKILSVLRYILNL